ncbi:MAG: carboxypeptidase-like regulatory domain-containing protein, partial [Schleiferiaceae bacterium]
QGEADSYQCAVDASGAFRISGVTPGSYELRIHGLKKGFKFSPTSVVVTDGNVLPVALHIEELEETIPMQQL